MRLRSTVPRLPAPLVQRHHHAIRMLQPPARQQVAPLPASDSLSDIVNHSATRSLLLSATSAIAVDRRVRRCLGRSATWVKLTPRIYQVIGFKSALLTQTEPTMTDRASRGLPAFRRASSLPSKGQEGRRPMPRPDLRESWSPLKEVSSLLVRTSRLSTCASLGPFTNQVLLQRLVARSSRSDQESVRHRHSKSRPNRP